MKSVPVTGFTVLGELPDPFVFEDGTQVKNAVQWEKRRAELRKLAVDIQYGILPPEPEFLEIEPLCVYNKSMSQYRIITGRRACPVVFKMMIFHPKDPGRCPAAVDGDLSFRMVYDKDFINAFTDNGVMLVLFDRTELAVDWMKNERVGQLYNAYPECTCGSIGAWAWGFSRCVDALEKLEIADMDHIIFTGHSRGGKASLLAGALDERASVVNSNGSGRGGSGCYRIQMEALLSNGEKGRDERMTDAERCGVLRWYGPEMDQYAGREAGLPFDQHFLKALVAPRILVETEAAEDIWCNTVGTWQTAEAAREVYRFLGAEDRQYLYFRDGGHAQTPEDVEKLISVVRYQINGTSVAEGSFELPFDKEKLVFEWRCP